MPSELRRIGDFLGDVVGVIQGGRQEIDAAALGAKGAVGVVQLRNKISEKLTKVGEKVGGRLGSGFLEAIANGASQANKEARAETQIKLFGFSQNQLWVGAAIVGGLGLLAYFWKAA